MAAQSASSPSKAMRLLRLGLLLSVTAMLAAVVADYLDSRHANSEAHVDEPAEISSELNSQADRYTWTQNTGNRRSVVGSAASFRQAKDTLGLELTGVELKIFHEDEETYDRIVTPAALFDPRTGRLHSEQEVTVTLGLSLDPAKARSEQPTTIRSTGVTFDSKASTCSTDRHTEYEFSGGRGHSTGAFYDSIHRYFHMKSDVYLQRFSNHPSEPPLEIRAGELNYHERQQRIDLLNGASLAHGAANLESAEAHLYLEDGVIRRIDAIDATGVEQQLRKTVRVRADRIEAAYTPQRTLERLTGFGSAEMVSTSSSSTTHVTGQRIDLRYVTPKGTSQAILSEADVRERARIEDQPLPGQEKTNAQVRRISAGWIHLKMGPGGEDMETIETVTPGTIELLPLQGGGPQRLIEAERIKAFYGVRNQMERLQAIGSVSLENRPPPAKEGVAAPSVPLTTWSNGLEADFDPESAELRRLRQWEGFRFRRGQRQGHSNEALFHPQEQTIQLDGQARVWDPEGSISARQIVLNEQTGDLAARQNVSSVQRSTATSADSGDDLFSSRDPVFAVAENMNFFRKDGRITYSGAARLWQGEDRIEAERIEIDQGRDTLTAEGGVISLLRDEPQGDKRVRGGPGPAPMIRVTADRMRYDESLRRVVYSGAVELRRDRLKVVSDQLESLFHPAGQDAPGRLREARAQGQVRIVERDGARQGFGQEADYEPDSAIVHLRGEPARLINQAGSETRGSKLTYHINDDRLLVLGGENNRAYSLRRRQP